MALAIAIEGLGVIANADAETDDTGGTGTGDWGWSGSGGVANGLTTDVFYYGISCISAALSGAKSGFLYFDRGAGNELDFDTAGSEEGQHLYIWIHCPTIGLIETIANTGLAIICATSLTDYRIYRIAGSDDSNGWAGGWKCFVIDPTKAGSVTDVGTYDPGSIRYVGAWMETTATAKGDNLFISQIAVGSGLRITGTSTTGWQDVVDYCTDLPSRAWGMFQKREGIYYQYGTVIIGDDTTPQAAAVSFTDSSRVIQAGISEYYISSSWATSADVDYMGLKIEHDSAATNGVTTFTDGILVGSNNGRSGSSFIGNANHDYSMDLFGGSNTDSVTALYGTTLSKLTGVLNSGDDTDHKFYGVSFLACSQFDPVGAPVIRNCVFSGYIGIEAALKWNANIDIADCIFAGNTDGTNDPAAIEHEAPGDFTYAGLTFSGNDYDIKNSNNSVNTDSYSESNRDADTQLNDTVFAVGQSLTGDGGTLGHVMFFLSKSGSPTGNAVAKIYAHSGTFGTDGIPTGAALATSNPVAVTGLDGTPTLTKFIFPLSQQMTLVNTTKYFVVIEYNDGTSSNYVLVGHDASTPGHGGNLATYTSSWAYDANKDACFYVRTGGIVNIAASGSNPSQGNVNDSGTPEGTTSIINTVTIRVNTVDRRNDPVADVSCAIYRTSDKAELLNEDSSGAGIASEDFNYPGSAVDIYWRVRESPSGGGDRFKADSGVGVITAGGYSVTVTMRPETVKE